MKSFDLHCDTIGECYKKSFLLRKNELNLDLERCKAIGEHTQVFAIWIPDELRGIRHFLILMKIG
jgi:membrane dipeptidase